MKNDNPALHYSRVYLFTEPERLKTPGYHGASIIFPFGTNKSIFTYHITHRYGDNSALWKPTRSPELVALIYHKAELAHIFVDDLRLEVSELVLLALIVKQFLSIECVAHIGSSIGSTTL
jgi:hypothetical protein